MSRRTEAHPPMYARLLLLLTRRLPASDPGVEIFGEQALLTHWLEHTPF